MVTLGRFTRSELQAPLEVRNNCEHHPLSEICRQPWFALYAAQQLGISAGPPATAAPDELLTVDDHALARHLLAVGASGTGKTQVLLRLLDEQIAHGVSALVVDVKGDLLEPCLGILARRKIRPEQVTIIDPTSQGSVPGWNPLLSGVGLRQSVNDLVSLMALVFAGYWGPRSASLMNAAALIAATHGLSLFEISRLLGSDAYREHLLRLPASSSEPLAFEEAQRFLAEDFGTWSPSERRSAVQPLQHKLLEVTGSEFWRALLCARHTTLDLERLFTEQHVVLVRLDRSSLGDVGSRLLLGMLVHTLFRVALRQAGRGTHPVALVMDELAVLARSIGPALAEIVTQARSLGLRFQAGFQHWAQLPADLRDALTGSCAVELFFRLGDDDAKTVAGALAQGVPPQLARITVSDDPQERKSCWTLRLVDLDNAPIPLGASVPYREHCGPTPWTTSVPLVNVVVPGLPQPAFLFDFLSTMSPDVWFEILCDLSVVWFRFPTPKFSNVAKTTAADVQRTLFRLLRTLPTQHALARVDGTLRGVLRVADNTFPLAGGAKIAQFAAASHRANSQSPADIAQLLRTQADEVAEVSEGRRRPTSTEEDDDGSIQ